jgi:uncharacterized protein (DUF885 family)
MNRFSLIGIRLFCAGAAMLAIISRAPAQEAEADGKLESFFRQYLQARFQLHPFAATQMGEHRFDHLLDDLSAPARARSLEHLRQTLKELPKAVHYAQLSRDRQIDYEMLRHELITAIWLEENTRPFEQNPRLYSDYISDSIFLLLSQSRLPKETNVANSISRMAHIPNIVAAARENLRNPPRPVLETAIRQNRGAIGFYEKGIFELVGETAQRAQLQAAAGSAATLLKNYQRFLEEDLLPRATGDWRLGKKKFSKKLELVLDAGLTADQVLADAEAEFTRVIGEMYVVSRQLWHRYFPKDALPPDDADGRRETIRRVMASVNQEHGKPEELVEDARRTVDRIKAFIRDRDILRLPEPDRCQVIEMPEFQRGNSLAYLNSAPPLDPEAPSLYAVSPPSADWDPKRVKSLLEEYNRHMLQILTIHEAYPGHYVQLEYSNRTRSLIRRILQSGVFIEGWAVYTEQTMLDQGYGEGDLALRLMQLKFYLRAVANAIFDHKMHCTSMNDEEALRFLTEQAFQSEEEARLKIIRAKQTSTQLSTYFVGRMAHYRLRQRVQRELGTQFDLGRFHEAVLDHGSVPVKYLPELVRARLARPR